MWDVNILLSCFDAKGPNKLLKINELGGKLVLLIMISQMCHLSDVLQLQLSNMQVWGDKRRFVLAKPTKMYNSKTFKVLWHDHQVLELRTFPDHPCLCPVTTLSDYLDQTQPYQGNIDDLFVLVTVQDPQPARHQTLSRWGKEWLTQGKIGVGVTVGSCRLASTTLALMMGMGLDEILGQVAWVHAFTFVNHYLKPMPVPSSSTFSKTSTLPSKTTSQVLHDPHLFSKQWHTDNIKARARVGKVKTPAEVAQYMMRCGLKRIGGHCDGHHRRGVQLLDVDNKTVTQARPSHLLSSQKTRGKGKSFQIVHIFFPLRRQEEKENHFKGKVEILQCKGPMV